MAFKSYKKESRSDWGAELPEDQKLSMDQIQLGCILRIADATEAMAKNHTQLQADLDWYKRQYNSYKERLEASENSNRSLRGVITKLRKAQQVGNK